MVDGGTHCSRTGVDACCTATVASLDSCHNRQCRNPAAFPCLLGGGALADGSDLSCHPHAALSGRSCVWQEGVHRCSWSSGAAGRWSGIVHCASHVPSSQDDGFLQGGNSDNVFCRYGSARKSSSCTPWES